MSGISKGTFVMEPAHAKLLMQFRLKLLEGMQPRHVTHILGSAGILTDEYIEHILAAPTRTEQARRVLGCLPTCGEHAFNSFCKALSTHPLNEELALLLGYTPLKYVRSSLS